MPKVIPNFTRARKGSRNANSLQHARRHRERVWGPRLVDRMIQVAKAVLADPQADVDALVADIRKSRRTQIATEGRDLGKIAMGGPDRFEQPCAALPEGANA